MKGFESARTTSMIKDRSRQALFGFNAAMVAKPMTSSTYKMVMDIQGGNSNERWNARALTPTNHGRRATIAQMKTRTEYKGHGIVEKYDE